MKAVIGLIAASFILAGIGAYIEPSVTCAVILFIATATGIGGIALALYRQIKMAEALRGEK